MKKYILSITVLMSLIQLFAKEPSAWLFSYMSPDKDNRGGLSYALSYNGKDWKSPSWKHRKFLDGGYAYKGQMKLLDPFVFQDAEKNWHVLWTAANINGYIGHSTTANRDNVVNWMRKSYPYFGIDSQITNPIAYTSRKGDSVVEFKTQDGDFYRTTTRDFKKFTPLKKISQRDYEASCAKLIKNIKLDSEELSGSINPLSEEQLEILKADGEWKKIASWDKVSQRSKDDESRFSGIEKLSVNVKADAKSKKKISDMLIGIFFEDLNYAADGGLYAELVQNRDFEYSNRDRWDLNPMSFWSVSGSAKHEVKTDSPIHENNKHYISLSLDKADSALVNYGYSDKENPPAKTLGIAVKKGQKYNFSCFVKGDIAKTDVVLADAKGMELAKASFNSSSKDWKKVEVALTSKDTSGDVSLKLVPLSKGEICFDMVSLFPQNTFKNRKNGLRADLAQTLAELSPKFVRFPGGCLVHAISGGEMNFYNWKDSVGALEARKPIPNCWGYHQTRGLGYYEFFLFCEDIGAEPLPVLAAGVGCQNPGQQAIDMKDMPQYTQDILDLIEWANGDPNTSKWAKLRADSGHPEPFNLKYIGIGNEDLISDQFEERFTMIYKAIKEKYPEIKVVGTSGPFAEGVDYREGWKVAKKLDIPLVDEHYYVAPGWFLYNQNYYDDYDRKGPKVYLGEYAAHIENRINNIETALSCAIHLANLERNGDVVEMSSYAPLLAKRNYTQWKPDLIYFDNSNVYPSTDYYVQKLFGQNSGDIYIPTTLELSEERDGLKERVICSVVCDSKSGDTIVKLINMLPFESEVNVDLSFIKGKKDVVKTVLSGDYSDQDAKPKESRTKLGGRFCEKLPPYSLTVLRFKK